MSNPLLTRREILLSALASSTISSAMVHAANPKLAPTDLDAQKVGYIEEATRVDVKKYPTYAKSQTCANCNLIQGRYGPTRPCSLFPGKLVTARGWCSAWSLRKFVA